MGDTQGSWHFPTTNGGEERGLDTSDMEMFKKNPIISLAREICQNSIDAADSPGGKPVVVEFQAFHVSRDRIPGIEDLTRQIRACCDYPYKSQQETNALQRMVKAVEAENFFCLRISDFNTMGAKGVCDFRNGMPFYNLTKGSGLSNKEEDNGGSKGIGKFATFVVSSLNTVFYATNAKGEGEKPGYFGVTRLRSIRPENGGPDDLTTGIGYFRPEGNTRPVRGILKLDDGFQRTSEEYGTDIYVLGVDSYLVDRWEDCIIASVLESFMMAIYKNRLTVRVGDKTVNQKTVAALLREIQELKVVGSSIRREMMAQYEILYGDDAQSEEVDIDGTHHVTVYWKAYAREEQEKATNYCVFIRYPYMRIQKYRKNNAPAPYSAICVIESGDLAAKLRRIENPQHTDWEINRLNESLQEKRETNSLFKTMRDKVFTCIFQKLMPKHQESMDLEGAASLLPAEGGLEKREEGEKKAEELYVTKLTRNSAKSRRPVSQPDDESGSEPGGSPTGGNSKGDGSSNGKTPSGDGEKGNGNRNAGKTYPYRSLVVDGKKGKYSCVVTVPEDYQDGRFTVCLLGSLDESMPAEIVDATINGEQCALKDGSIVGVSLKKDKKYKISYTIALMGMYASEVIFHANR
ncbi:MAG: hypothetical protein ACFWT7_00770 [Succiniclasticum sp.]|jgi:hypothetical protein